MVKQTCMNVKGKKAPMVEPVPQWQSRRVRHTQAVPTQSEFSLHTSDHTGPFSSQGGNFDVADRMFHSVQNAWESASRENMSDVRELTPEFFYLPEFLVNCNAVEFGEWRPGCGQGGLGSAGIAPLKLISND